MIDSGPDPAEGTGALAWTDRFDEAVRRRSRWFSRFLLTFGFVTLGGTALPGFVGGIWAGAVFAVSFGGFGVLIAVYAGREPVAARVLLPRHALIITVWTVLFWAVVSAGVAWFSYNPAWWLPGAAVVSLPLFVGAYLEHRRGPAENPTHGPALEEQ